MRLQRKLVKIYKCFVYFIMHNDLCFKESPDIPSFVKEWLPRTDDHPCAMYWGKTSLVKEVKNDEVLSGFPQEVYIR